MAKVVPINKKERKLWKKWERQGFSEQQRRSFLNQERRFQRELEEFERNRRNDEEQQRRDDTLLQPVTNEEKKLWAKWKGSGLIDKNCAILLKQHREWEKELEEHKARMIELYKQGKVSAEEVLPYLDIDPKQEREANIVVACILAIPVLLIVLVVFFFVSQPMILMCICWAIGMLLAMAFGR